MYYFKIGDEVDVEGFMNPNHSLCFLLSYPVKCFAHYNMIISKVLNKIILKRVLLIENMCN